MEKDGYSADDFFRHNEEIFDATNGKSETLSILNGAGKGCSVEDQSVNQKVPNISETQYDNTPFDFKGSSDSEEHTPLCDTYSTALYKKLSSVLDGFKGLMFSNWQLRNVIVDESSVSQQPDTVEDTVLLSLTERLCYTMDNLFRGAPTMERLVAFIPTFSPPKPGFNLADAFVPEHENFVDCFALFIQDNKSQGTPNSSNDTGSIPVDCIGDNLRCEIVNKVSKRVISESGPYHCVFEENIDSETPNEALLGFMGDLAFSSGRLRFFQAIKSLGKYKETLSRRITRSSRDPGTEDQESTSRMGSTTFANFQSPGSFLKSRLNLFSDYLSRTSDDTPSSPHSERTTRLGSISGRMIRSYFSCAQSKEAQETPDLDDNARHRMEEHILVHTDHWDEFQYDNIEIVLRDDNDSVVKLPYSCAVM
ncbi:hypothetical protein X943_002010 [Babesia divergens]|uniref:Uncharacterized protein n=1 Tax=Babesia divergens TaxID=32595 RepID=A0AAD9G763_BABDI|nr:hypothetical protein X943_002010 [Babesia divergens]